MMNKHLELNMSYTSLNDAAVTNPILAAGETKIWYTKFLAGRDMRMGLRFITEHNMLPDTKNLAATHVLIGSIKGSDDLEKVFMAMQGENWSPEGQAREMIRALNTNTSMSVGDIIETNGKFYFVDSFGFSELK